MQAWRVILLGFMLCVSGVVLPFLMLMHALPSTFFLNFFTYSASTTGLILGIIGASLYVRQHRK